jgi:hypothetical protein
VVRWFHSTIASPGLVPSVKKFAPVLPLSVAANAYPCASTQSEIALSFAYCARTPGDPATTSPPFHFFGSLITYCESWFHPWLVLVFEESGKYPSICTPGTPDCGGIPAEVSPA